MNRFALLLVVFASAADANAQAMVKGRVVNREAAALPGVRIALNDSLNDLTYSAISDSAGDFWIRLAQPIESSVLFVTAEMLGYRSIEHLPLRINARDELTVVLWMDVDAIPLEPLRVVARGRYSRGHLDEYDERAAKVKRFGGGRIVEYQQLQNRRGLSAANLLPELIANRSCPPSVFIDGMKAMPFDTRTLSISDVEGIEVYATATQTPLRYQGRSTCGAVLFWTQIGDRAEPKPIRWRSVFIVGGIIAAGALLAR